jgi:hypothetical protein
MCRFDLRVIGFPRSAAPRAISFPGSASSDRPSPGPFDSGSSSRAQLPLRSAFVSPSGLPFRGCPSCWGFRPSARHHQEVSTIAAASQATATFRPQVFSTSRRLAPPSGFAGLFHPAATSRVPPSRGFSRSRAAPDSSPGRAPLPLPPPCSPASRLPQSNDSTSRRSSRDRSVHSELGVSLLRGRSPLRFSSSFRCSPTHRSPGSPGPPLVTFPVEALLRAEARNLNSPAAFSVSPVRSPMLPSPESPTCSRFHACRGVAPSARRCARGYALSSTGPLPSTV